MRRDSKGRFVSHRANHKHNPRVYLSEYAARTFEQAVRHAQMTARLFGKPSTIYLTPEGDYVAPAGRRRLAPGDWRVVGRVSAKGLLTTTASRNPVRMPRGTPQISNRSAADYVEQRKPFRASNIYGRTLRDGSYAVFSYGEHWPMFAWVDGQWYENEDRYSVTTSKHRSQSHPHKLTSKLSVAAIRQLVAEHNPAGTRVARCVRDVQRRGGAVNAYAVCQRATGQSYRTGRALANPRRGPNWVQRNRWIADLNRKVREGRLSRAEAMRRIRRSAWAKRAMFNPVRKVRRQSPVRYAKMVRARVRSHPHPAAVTRKRGVTRRSRTYRVVAVNRAGRVIGYLAEGGSKLNTVKTQAMGFAKPHLARHWAEHMAMRFGKYRWGVESP